VIRLGCFAAAGEYVVKVLVERLAVPGTDRSLLRSVSGESARVLIEVWDADPRPPVPRPLGEDGMPDLEEEGGHGE